MSFKKPEISVEEQKVIDENIKKLKEEKLRKSQERMDRLRFVQEQKKIIECTKQ